MPRVLTTTQSEDATLSTTDGNPYPVQPVGAPGAAVVIPPLYSVVFRPGDTSGADNVFQTFAALYAACVNIQGPVRVLVDDSLGPTHMTAGAYVLDNWQFYGQASFADSLGFAILTIDAGVTWDGSASRTLDFTSLDIRYAGAADVCTVAVGAEFNLNLNYTSLVTPGAGAILNIATSGGGGFAVSDLENFSTIGDGVHAVIKAGVAPGFAALDAITATSVNAACITAGVVSIDSSCSLGIVAAPAYTIVFRDDATFTSYTAANAAKWSGTNPTSVAYALDRIAAMIGPIP